jgi:predicted metalloprotease with PDZ domain
MLVVLRLAFARPLPVALLFVASFAVLSHCTQTPLYGQKKRQQTQVSQQEPLVYEINLQDRSDDTFKVRLRVGDLKASNAVYQFAATAPGAYQVMDIGRYVRRFQAFDISGKEIRCKRLSTNQWQISQPTRVAEIRYSVAETFDTPVERDEISRMCGSSLEDDHALFNPHTVIGFPAGMQARPVRIQFLRPPSWEIATAMEQDAEGYYLARDYDYLVDSPVLLGKLTRAQTTVTGTAIEIYTYSKNDEISSEQLLSSMKAMLNAAGAFLGELPVKRYTFLFHFDDVPAGAWEHSYSSVYVLEDRPFNDEYGQFITDIAAHEFFHIITPLNIHSELIAQFNFVKPTPSEHLWLYEGVTEWASHIMQLRSGLKTPEQYFADLSQKVFVDNAYFDRFYSLSKLSLNCYTDSGQRQYSNIYYRGALVAGMLDIRLLELSNGKRGLREVIQDLMKKYGPERAFPEKRFFEEFVSITYPEIADFFELYVKKATPLPLQEYYAKIGVLYSERAFSDTAQPELGLKVRSSEGKLIVDDFRETLAESGLRLDDEILSINGQAINEGNARMLNALAEKLGEGASYEMVVARKEGGAQKEITLQLTTKASRAERRHVFTIHPQAYFRQAQLRKAWLKNL